MLDTLRKKAAQVIIPKKNSSSFGVLSTQSPGIPVYSEMTVRKATREGYKISGSVYRAVRVVVQAASAIPWVVLNKDGEVIPEHDFTKVWSHPNREFSGQDNMELIVAHLKLVGNAFIQPIIVNGKPIEFWVCMPDLIQPVPPDVPGEWLKGYLVTGIVGGQYMVPAERFIHFQQFDPGNPYWGIGDLMAAARTVDSDNEAQDTQKITMQNRGTPDGVFEVDALTDEQYEEATRRIQERYLDKTKRRLPWVIAGAKWHQMSLTPVEMDFMQSRLQNKRDIAAVFGVDPWFLGDNEHSSYNNILEAKKALYEETVIPLLDDIKATLNLKVAPLYGNDIIISYDTSKVVALRADFSKKVEQADKLWRMGIPFDQINERLEMGFTEFTGWDRGFLPLNLMPTGAPIKEVTEDFETKTLNLETEEAKTAHWKRVDRRRIGWWGVVSKKVEALYKDEGEAVVKACRGKTNLDDAANDAINNLTPEWEKMMTAVLSALIEDFGSEIAEDFGGKPKFRTRTCPKCGGERLEATDNGYICIACREEFKEAKWTFDPMSLAARAWIAKNGAASITSIVSTNLADVRRVILAGTNENLSTSQISKNIQRFYTDHSPTKAMRVARTEVCKASSFGSLEAARQSQVAQSKTWLTSRDDRVRDEHEAMDGETVGLNDIFSNGLEFPSEPMCRCVLTFQTRR